MEVTLPQLFLRNTNNPMAIELKQEKFLTNDKNNKIVLKLIYLWAFMEAGLGGFLHLLHIPLTGFIVGGFAIIIIVLLTKFGNNRAEVLLKAFGIVLAVKFLLSPYTPFGAYIALSFQVFLAVILFLFVGLNRLTIFLFATVVMLESGLQKPILAYFVLGKEFWESVVELFSNTSSISILELKEMAFVLFMGYLLLYFVWGIILSNWSYQLYKDVQNLEFDIDLKNKIKLQIQDQNKRKVRKNKKYKSIFIGFILLILFFVIPFSIDKLTSLYTIRTLGLVLIFWVIAPYIIRKQQHFFYNKNRKAVLDIIETFPLVKERTYIAWQQVSKFRGLKKLKYFVSYTIWINIFYEQS